MTIANDLYGVTIYSYSREQAIADGVLIDVSETAQELGFKFPVALTESVWKAYIEWTVEDTKKQTHQDTNGRLWDVLSMLRFSISSRRDSSGFLYKLFVVARDGISTRARLTQLKAVVGGGEKGEPVITIMLPNED
jgi:hypothetical protein